MLVKLTEGVNFIKVLCAHFSYESASLPKRNKKKGFCTKKRTHKMLVKLTEGVSFIKVLRAHFLYESAFLPKRN
jgi:hypothetical protein